MTSYDFFLAHASADKSRARELYRLLTPEVKVFLDAESLMPGDDWTREIPKAQQRSLATVILVSRAAEAAYYLRDEIATAIAIHRARPEAHRAIPVFLDGIPRDPMEIPYGLRILNGLDLQAEGGMAQVAQRLKAAAARPHGEVPLPPQGDGQRVPAQAAPVAAPESAGHDASRIYERLCKLMLSQFESFLFLAGLPLEHIPTQPAPIAARALSVVMVLQQGGPDAWKKALAALRQVAPGLA